MSLSFKPADNTNPLFLLFAEHFRPAELDALIDAIINENDPTDAERLDLLQSVREPFGPPAVTQDAGPGFRAQGMQWLVLGMVPGPVEFLVGTDTRNEALAEMREQDIERFDYVAVVKARDFFAAE